MMNGDNSMLNSEKSMLNFLKTHHPFIVLAFLKQKMGFGWRRNDTNIIDVLVPFNALVMTLQP
jgi:hypothetical protein